MVGVCDDKQLPDGAWGYASIRTSRFT